MKNFKKIQEIKETIEKLKQACQLRFIIRQEIDHLLDKNARLFKEFKEKYLTNLDNCDNYSLDSLFNPGIEDLARNAIKECREIFCATFNEISSKL